MPKKKILWVVYDFVQAGGERYVFEICKSLNKEKYQVDILHVNLLGSEKAWKTEYYYQPSIDAGCTVFGLEELLQKNKITKKPFGKRLIKYYKRKMGAKFEQPLSQSDFISNFFKSYHHVNFSGTAIYKSFCIDRNIEPENGIIHILTAQFQQSKDLYEGYHKTFNYNFVSSIPEKSQRQDLKEFKNYRLTYFPLCMATQPYNIVYTKKREEGFKIAVFTRLSTMKPLDPYFYALKLLLEQGIEVVLDVYGAGDPEKLGLIRQLNYLYIDRYVNFKGHTESIPETLKEAGIDLIWFQSNNNVPAGYAALEITMSGLPQVFWDFHQMDSNDTGESIFPSFTNMALFTELSQKILNTPALAQELGEKQRKFVIDNNSSDKQIHILEKMYGQ